jgi:L-glutamine-phosphate cytidylyltransferase
MKAIIVAAGRGRRLGTETDAIPKCMVAVAGRAILHHQLDALAAAGVDDFVVVRGYRGDLIAPPPGGPPLRFVDNPDWAENNILTSLFFAEHEMQDGFLFSYSDIVFAPEHARALVAATTQDTAAITPAPVTLVIDRRWREAYDGRRLHPVSEAELARVDGDGTGAMVTRVGKRLVGAEEAAGEFIGLARFSSEGAAALTAIWKEARAAGRRTPFGAAATLDQAYLSDALNALVARGTPLRPLFIDGRWREIDTEEDLARAERAIPTWT